MRLQPIFRQSDQQMMGPGSRGQQGETNFQRLPDQVDDGDMNGSMMDYQYVKCGYGKLIWPDASTFEGFWING